MNTLESIAFLASVLVFAWALDYWVLRAIVEGGDTGSFWARVLRHWTIVCSLVFILAITRDFTDFVASRIPGRAPWWLAGLWLMLVAAGVAWPPSSADGRWIAGGIGFENQRYWVAGLAAALLVPLGYSFAPSDAFDSLLWACGVVLSATVLMIALSQDPAAATADKARPSARSKVATSSPLPEWPAAMASFGIQLEALPSLGAMLAGSVPVIPVEMQSAIEKLVAAGPMQPEEERIALILAPVSCGQEQALNLAISTLQERSEEVALIITPVDPQELLESLSKRLGDRVKLAVVRPGSSDWTEANVWMVEASVLSQHLLKNLREDSTLVRREALPLMSRVGLIVWWDVHEYSGVRAANLWAISRRLDRLLKVKGRTGLRTLLFSAAPTDATDRSAAFLSHLFPYEIPQNCRVTVKPQLARVVHPFIARNPASETASASVRTGWPTRAFATEARLAQSFVIDMDPKLAQSLVPSLSQADATVVAAGSNQISNLSDLLATFGRHAHADLPHYVALVLPQNPYIDYLMSVYKERQRIPSQRLLVGAEGHPVLIERHAQLALTEYPDTLAGLKGIFRWDDQVLTSTIRNLNEYGPLHRDPVRFLDDEQRLRRDFLYSNQQPGRMEGSLDTVGTTLIEAKETDSRNAAPAFSVDPERVVIDAYPRRVFFSGSKRYRVEEADSEFVRCRIEEENVVTWRGRTSRFIRLTRETEPMTTRGVKRYSVSGTYREELTDVIESVAGSSELRRVGLDSPRKTEFSTRALVLETGREADPDALQLAALALRCILPVHVGADETHLEVLPLLSEKLINGGFTTGLAFIDLMPGGIGVTEAFQDDEALLRFLIDQAHDWLHACLSKKMTAQTLFKDVPVAIATGGVAGLRLEGAVSLLAAMAGKGTGPK